MNGFEAYKTHINPVLAELENLAGMSRRFVRAEGCNLWDDAGNRFLDFISGHGSQSLGHNPPGVVNAIVETSQQELLQVYGLGANPHMGNLAKKLTGLIGDPFEIAFFTSSGAEAVEGALKIARAASGRHHVLYCHGAYHGMTLGSLSMMARGPWRDPFEPLLSGFTPVTFNDLDEMRDVLGEYDVAAVVLEPIQVEAGIQLPDPGYLSGVKDLCRQHGAYMILDEISTGLGRTGPLFAFQDDGIVPDIITVAKSLGGGILPMGAYLTTRDIFQRAYGSYEMCAAHHSTFGGNSLCCLTAFKALELLTAPGLSKTVVEKGNYLLESLQKRLGPHSIVREVRGKGLLLGVEFLLSDHPWLAWENMELSEFKGHNAVPILVMRHLLKNGIITQICGHNWNVLKLVPPLVVEKSDIDRFVDAIEEAVEWIGSIT